MEWNRIERNGTEWNRTKKKNETEREGTQQNGSPEEILNTLPDGAVIVMEDLELWWERTNDGYAVLQEIMDLIRTFGKKIFFIINSNSYSINQINKVFQLEDNLLRTIECEPFDAKKLQQLVQYRHKTSGLSYYYKNISEDNVSQIAIASLFIKLARMPNCHPPKHVPE